MTYEITLIDKYGEEYIEAFEDTEAIQEEINMLDGYLEDVSGSAYSRIQSTIIQLQDLLSSIEQ